MFSWNNCSVRAIVPDYALLHPGYKFDFHYTGAMVRYRRNFVAGGTFFFTLTLRDRTSRVLVEHIDALREAFRAARDHCPFAIEAIVVMPDHLHVVMTLPPDDAGFASRIRFVKSRFSRRVAQAGAPIYSNSSGEYDLWQRRYWEHTIRDEEDLQRHVDYIHFNPVKHGHAKRAVDWPHSSIHRYIRAGWLNEDWAFGAEGDGADFGERPT